MLSTDHPPLPTFLPLKLRRMPDPHAAPHAGHGVPLTRDGLGHLDWDLLLDAVKSRLQQAVEIALARRSDAEVGPALAQAGATMAECAGALDKLHNAFTHECIARRQVEAELLEVRKLLALARTELVGTQDMERRARHLALHDSLTGLPNRRYFMERLSHGIRHLDQHGPMLAVLYLDLDDFKLINDQHGHDIGDEVLRVVSARLSHAVRSEDTLSRLGGDEFACLRVGQLDPEELLQFARKLFNAIAMPLQIGQASFNLRASVGIALASAKESSCVSVLKRADLAMYEAKRRQLGCLLLHENGPLSD